MKPCKSRILPKAFLSFLTPEKLFRRYCVTCDVAASFLLEPIKFVQGLEAL